MNRQTPLRRDVVVIIVVGALLGVAYNAMGLASRPQRGIPWVAVKTALPSLEEMVPADSLGTGEPAPPASAPEVGGPGAPGPPAGATSHGTEGAARTATPATGAAGSTGTTTTTTAPGAGGAPSSTAGGGAAPPVATPAAGVVEPRRVPLPFIPDSDQPIQLQIATVKRFFDARAALFLDARDPAEYEKGHIPGAIRLTNPEAQNEPERVKALPVEGRPTIVYCEGGACEASLDLARFLLESGFKKVLVYMGGYPEWEAAGHPVERGSGR